MLKKNLQVQSKAESQTSRKQSKAEDRQAENRRADPSIYIHNAFSSLQRTICDNQIAAKMPVNRIGAAGPM
jgi:hypothetical protein